MQSKSQLSAHFLLINACVTCQTIKLINCWTNFITATFCAFKGGRRILNPFAPLGSSIRDVGFFLPFFIKFIYSEKATKFCDIFTLLLTTVHRVKRKGKISQNFVAFSEYMNFNCNKFNNAYSATKFFHY